MMLFEYAVAAVLLIVASLMTGVAAHLARQAMRDTLTGLNNRLSLDAELHKAIAGNRPACTVLIDLDHFKDVNDTLGHKAGDALLVSVADVIRAQVRKGDLAFRYGGDELLLLLPRCTMQDAEVVVTRIAGALDQTFAAVRDQGIPVGCSMGMTEACDADTPDSLVSRADAALYRAKRGGRGRVEATYAAC